MPPRSPKMKRRIFGFQRRVWCPKCTPDSSSSRMPTSAIESLPCGFVWHCAGRCRGVGGPGVDAGQGRLPRAPGGSPGSKRYEKALPVYASSVWLLRYGLCGPALPSPTSGGPVRAVRGGAARTGRPASSFRPPEGAGEVRGERRAHVHEPLADGVSEGEALRVEELALEAEQPGAAVLGVAGDWMPDRLQVGADLVGPARLEAHAQQREAVEGLLRLEVGHSL